MAVPNPGRTKAEIERVGYGSIGEQPQVDPCNEVLEPVKSANRVQHKTDSSRPTAQEGAGPVTELEEQALRLSVLNELGGVICQTPDLQELLKIALRKVVGQLGLRGGWIHLGQGRDDSSDPIVAYGLPDWLVAAHYRCVWHRALGSEVLTSGQGQVLQDSLPFSCPIVPSSDDAEVDRRRKRRGRECPYAAYSRAEGLGFAACVPLESKGRVKGIMSLIGHVGRHPHSKMEDTRQFLVAIGRQLGVAIENASLHEAIREKEALHRHLLSRLITAQEQERQRIARELHDQTSQSLASLIVALNILAKARSLEEAQGQAMQLRDEVSDALTEVHGLASQLRPRALDELGLVPALRELIKDNRRRFRLVVDLQVVGTAGRRLSAEEETSLYRIAQEALTNVARHGRASTVSVLLENRAEMVVLIVEDDGVGFDVDQVMRERPNSGALGLQGMEERASLVGGTLTVESSPETGTTVYAVLPSRD